MPIISPVGRRSWKVRSLFILMYVILAVLGVTMVIPFLITLTASVSTPMDYQRYSVLPRSLWSREERFVRGLVPYYPDAMRNSVNMLSMQFQNVPAKWSNWTGIGDDTALIDTFAQQYLTQASDPTRWKQAQLMASDYNAFDKQYPITDTLCSYNLMDSADYIKSLYKKPGDKSELEGLTRLGDAWGVPYDSYYNIAVNEVQIPWDQPGYMPARNARAKDFGSFAQAYRDRKFLSNSMRKKWIATNGESMPISEARPYPLKVTWIGFLGSATMRDSLKLPAGGIITTEEFNTTFGTTYANINEIPFPVPATAPAKLQETWTQFVQKQFPIRLLELTVTPEVNAAYRTFIQSRFKNDLARTNEILGTTAASWEQITLDATLPDGKDELRSIWLEYVGLVPAKVKTLHCAEMSYQDFLLKKYGSLEKVNATYGWKLNDITQAEMPYDMAYLVSFINNEHAYSMISVTSNYTYVLNFLVLRGRALFNTLVLIVLTLLAALTINPIAAYALSRFRMKQMPAIILFMLATMAFPAAVSMIPGYLLMRDLHLLNTYAALILPGIASGMSIFLLKGFFDSLPPELYEAASLDGAPEWMMFLRITMPLSKPILALIALNCFLGAYSGWEWAIVVCQNPKMWTIAVWLYQFNTTAANMPWAVMASFVISSIPVFLVFTFCQNIILRGIILPQMK